MARALVVGCGCWGRALGSELAERGWQVRGTTRTPAGLAAIEDAGHEGAVADPDRPGTILDLVGDVAVVVWLLGSAEGEPEAVAGIHGTRLQSLLERLVDTPVRGIAYQSEGSAPAEALAGGRAAVEAAAETWRIPVTWLGAPAGAGWPAEAAGRVEGLLAPKGVNSDQE